MRSDSFFLKAGAACSVAAAISLLPPALTPANAATKPASKVKNGTFTGISAQTRFGPVQVRVTIAGGRITKVAVPVYPVSTPRDQMINSQAIPMLTQEVMQLQSSNIQGIGGASYTSQGFYDSLLSALAKSGHA